MLLLNSLTTVDIGKNAEQIMKHTQHQTQSTSRLRHCLSRCLLAALVLITSVVISASIVFVIQALIVGTATYLDPSNNNCQSYIGVYLIILGALGVSCLFCLFTGGDSSTAGEEPYLPSTVTYHKKSRIWAILVILVLFSPVIGFFCWLIYGVSIIFGPNHLKYWTCSQSQYKVFEIMILFMFSAMVAYFLFFIFIYYFCFRSGRLTLIRKESNLLTAVNHQDESDPESYFADHPEEMYRNSDKLSEQNGNKKTKVVNEYKK